MEPQMKETDKIGRQKKGEGRNEARRGKEAREGSKAKKSKIAKVPCTSLLTWTDPAASSSL